MSVSLDGRAAVSDKRGWLAVVAAMLSQMLAYGVVLGSFSFWVADWAADFHTSKANIMYAITITYLVAAIASPVVGMALQSWPARFVVVLGILLFSLGYVLLAMAQSVWHFILIYSIGMGGAWALCGPVSAQALVSKWFIQKQGLALGIAFTGSAIGGMIMPPLIAHLLATLSWRTVSLSVGLLGVAVAPVVWLLIQEPGGVSSRSSANNVARLPSVIHGITVALVRTDFWIIVLAFLPICVAFQAVGANFSLLMQDTGIAAQRASFYLGFMGFCTIIFKPIIGRLADAVDNRKLLFIGTLIIGTGYLITFTAEQPSNTRLVVGSVLMSTAPAFFFPLQGTIVSRYLGRESFASIVGALNFFFLIGALGPLLAALTRDRFGTYLPFILAAAVIPAIASLPLLSLKRSPAH
jgi:MFS family permease